MGAPRAAAEPAAAAAHTNTAIRSACILVIVVADANCVRPLVLLHSAMLIARENGAKMGTTAPCRSAGTTRYIFVVHAQQLVHTIKNR